MCRVFGQLRWGVSWWVEEGFAREGDAQALSIFADLDLEHFDLDHVTDLEDAAGVMDDLMGDLADVNQTRVAMSDGEEDAIIFNGADAPAQDISDLGWLLDLLFFAWEVSAQGAHALDIAVDVAAHAVARGVAQGLTQDGLGLAEPASDLREVSALVLSAIHEDLSEVMAQQDARREQLQAAAVCPFSAGEVFIGLFVPCAARVPCGLGLAQRDGALPGGLALCAVLKPEGLCEERVVEGVILVARSELREEGGELRDELGSGVKGAEIKEQGGKAQADEVKQTGLLIIVGGLCGSVEDFLQGGDDVSEDIRSAALFSGQLCADAVQLDAAGLIVTIELHLDDALTDGFVAELHGEVGEWGADLGIFCGKLDEALELKAHVWDMWPRLLMATRAMRAAVSVFESGLCIVLIALFRVQCVVCLRLFKAIKLVVSVSQSGRRGGLFLWLLLVL